MDVTIDEAVTVLEEQLAPLDGQVTELECQLGTLKETQKRLRAALNALKGGGKSLASSPKKKCVKKLEVVRLVQKYLERDGSIPIDELKQFVSATITKQGWSLSGFGLRFKEAIGTPEFTVSPGNVVTLRQPKPGIDATKPNVDAET